MDEVKARRIGMAIRFTLILMISIRTARQNAGGNAITTIGHAAMSLLTTTVPPDPNLLAMTDPYRTMVAKADS